MSFGNIKSFGVGSVKAMLRNVAERAPPHAARVMRTWADKIETKSKLQCPHDDGELEDSIHQEVMRDEGNKRLVIAIVAGGVVRGVDVDEYAVLIHENYEGQLKHGPGKHTLEKIAANPGVVIGSKFIQRAVDEAKPRLVEETIQAVLSEVPR